MSTIETAILELTKNNISESTVRDIVAIETSDLVTETKLNSTFEDFKAELRKTGTDTDSINATISKAIAEAIGTMPATKLVISTDGVERKVDGHKHEKWSYIYRNIAADLPVMLTGPAGSGKSTILRQIAEAMDLVYYVTGPMQGDHKALGYENINGSFVPTEAYRAFKNGGLWVLEESDASNAWALVAVNLLVTEPQVTFGSGEVVQRHPDFRVALTGNTWGKGASRIYTRNQLDGAFLDRFAMIFVGYDETLERAAAQNDPWVDMVQSVRRAVDSLELREVISPRASIMGAKMIASYGDEFNADDRKEVAESFLWKGMDKPTRDKIRNYIEAN